MTDIETRVKKVIAFWADASEPGLSNGASLVGDLHLSGVNEYLLADHLEDEFGTVIPMRDLRECITVQHVIDYVTARTGEKAAA